MPANLDIDYLRAFLAVAEIGNFTRAGQTLHRTQSAVSMQIKRLEESIGKRLFHRAGRSVSLTNDGDLLLEYARRILRLNDEVMSHLTRPELEGTVRLGSPDDYASMLFPPVLAQFARGFPRVRVDVVCQPSPDLLGLLERGELDLALLTRMPETPGGETMRREPLVWCGSPLHPTHEEDPLPLAMFPGKCLFRTVTFQALDSVGRGWRMAYSSSSTAALKAAVVAGLAVSVFAHRVVPDGVRILGTADGLPELPSIELALHRVSAGLTPAASRLAEYIKDHLREPDHPPLA